jgi:hypothetical protein
MRFAMARKETPKPLFDLKHDFYVSLDNVAQQAINLMQAVDQAIDLGGIKEGPLRDLLAERSKALRDALMSE